MNRKLLNLKQLTALILMLVLTITAVPVALAESFSAYVYPTEMPVYSNAAMTKKIGSLPAYTVFKVVDFNGDLGAAQKINYNGNVGYALPRYWQGVAENSEEATINANTKVYLVYGDASTAVSVPAGTKVNVFAVNNGFAAIERSGVGAFVSLQYLTYESGWSPEDFTGSATPTPTPTAAPTAAATAAPDMSKAIPAVVTKDVKVYAGKTTSTKYLGTMKKGWTCNVVETGDYWAYVERNGAFGYCSISALTPAAAATSTPDMSNAVPAVVTKAVKVYASKSTSSKYLGTMQKGWEITLVGSDGTWAQVMRNGDYGYCSASAVKAKTEAEPTPDMSNAVPAVVTKAVKVYASKSTSSKYLGTMQKGWEITLVSSDGTWAQVMRKGDYGYCSASAVKAKTEAEPAPTTTPNLTEEVPAVVLQRVNVYASKSTSSKYLGTMQKGWEITLVDYDDTWAYVKRNGDYGYCSIAAIMPALTKAEAIPATVSASSLKFYAAPSTSAKWVGTLKKGGKVNVRNMADGWAFVERNGDFAWCQLSGLKMSENETENPLAGWTMETFTATVISNTANIYEDVDTGSTSLSVPMGKNVTIIGYKQPWAAVMINDSTVGFMQIEDLSRDIYAELSNGSSGTDVSTLEKALLARGYFDDVPDNTYNSYTAEAVKLFQSACGMTQTGSADINTLRVLYGAYAPAHSLLSGTYEKGDSGSGVKRIQTRLYALDYLSKSASVDGEYGSNTYNAVKLFQSANSLSATGTVDSNTLKKLYSANAVKLPSGKTPADAINVVTPSTGNQANNSTTISSTLKSTTSTYSSSMTGPQKAEYLIYVGQNQLGKPYVYGATGTSSFDCSGFTWYCFKQVGVTLPRTAYSQGYNKNYDKVTKISDLERGALVYFNTVSDSDSCDHAGIYLGAGWFIHASSGQAKVVVSNLSSGYYNGVFSWGHNVL